MNVLGAVIGKLTFRRQVKRWWKEDPKLAEPGNLRDLTICPVSSCRSKRVVPDFSNIKLYGDRIQIPLRCPDCHFEGNRRATREEFNLLMARHEEERAKMRKT